MIKIYNEADQIFEMSQAGNLTVAANLNPVITFFSGYLIGVFAAVGSVGTGSSAVVDILQNEVSIYGATKLVFPASVRFPTYQPFTTDPLPITAGDVFTLKVTTAFGTTQSVDLAVDLLARRRYQSPPAASFKGDWGLDVVYYA